MVLVLMLIAMLVLMLVEAVVSLFAASDLTGAQSESTEYDRDGKLLKARKAQCKSRT
jgi:Na+-transporting NADH:ubiquinone oxidoreductase subunit NqrC